MELSRSKSNQLSRPNILVLEEKKTLHRHFKNPAPDYKVSVTSEVSQAVACATSHNGSRPDLIVIDVSQGKTWHGLEYGKELRQLERQIPIILLTNEGSEDFALAVLRSGINDYLKEPFDPVELWERVTHCLQHPFHKQAQEQKTDSPKNYLSDILIGVSTAIEDVRTYITKVASTESNVLITGETGTGKELVAQAIHQNSERYQQPFVCVNCAAIPDTLLESELFGYERGAFTGAITAKRGKLEQAQSGTIFFDEIGDMELLAQAKVLRAIEERQVHPIGGSQGRQLDIRVIAATNHNLEQSMTLNQFRTDLFYRLNVARIHLPSLRDRKEDIPILTQYIIQELNPKFNRIVEGLTEEAMAHLLNYTWPGNVRELRNLIEASFINLPNSKMKFMDLPPQFRAKARELESLPQNERDRILAALLSTNWSRIKAANKLQWSRMTLYRKMLKYNIANDNGKTTHENSKQAQPNYSTCNIT